MKFKEIFEQNKLINFIFLLTIIGLSTFILLTYLNITKLLSSNSWVSHTYQVIIEINHLNLYLAKKESEVNLYVFAPNKTKLNEISNISQMIDSAMINLKNLTADNARQQSRLNQLESLIKEKTEIANQIILTGPTNINNAKSLAAGTKREVLKKEISRLISSITDDELQLLSARNDESQVNLNRSFQGLLISILSAEIIFLISFLLLNNHLRLRRQHALAQTQAKDQLRLINDKLKENEERFLLATESSNVGLWDWIPNTDNVYYSISFKKMLGYNHTEFPNVIQSFNDVVHPEDINRVWELIDVHLNKKIPFNIEYRLCTKSGEYKWFKAGGRAIWDKNGIPIRMLGSIIDINEKKINEERIAVQHEIIQILSSGVNFKKTFLKIIEALHKIFPFDTATAWLSDENQTLSCAVFANYLPDKNSEFEKKTKSLNVQVNEGIIHETYHNKKTVFIPNILEEKNFIRRNEAKVIGLRSGYFIPIIVKKSVYGVFELLTTKSMQNDEGLINFFLHIGFLIGESIERYLASLKLQHSEAYKSAILDSALESILTIDLQGKILSCNKQTSQMFDYDDANLLNANIQILLPQFNEIFSQLIKQKILETVGKNSHNEDFLAEVVISKMKIQPNGYVLIIRNISERKRIEKMKNEFISLVSHELRTPLTSIQGSLDLMLDDTSKIDEDTKILLNIAKQNSERLIRLINDILDIEKIEVGRMEFRYQLISLDALIDEAVSLNQTFAIKNETFITYQIKTQGLYVNVDHDRLIQVLTNILSNAVKFSPKNAEVKVLVEKIDSGVRISISDQGQGISEQFQKQIFQKFAQEDSTVRRMKGGTGLGLSISKAIIETMKGKINFTTSKTGTTFFFELPVTLDTPRASQTVDELERQILIAETDPATIQLIKKRVRDHNFTPLIVTNIEQIEDFLKNGKIDAMMLNYTLFAENPLPKIYAQILHRKFNLPIVEIQEKFPPAFKNQNIFIIETLQKPFNENQLIHSIKLIMDYLSQQKIKILHIEDDVAFSQVLQKTLNYDYDVFHARGKGPARVALAQKDFDLVILDIKLPDGSGEDLIPEIANKKIPIIVFTAYELPDKFKPYVENVLIKSKTTNKKILSIIKSFFEKTKEEY